MNAGIAASSGATDGADDASESDLTYLRLKLKLLAKESKQQINEVWSHRVISVYLSYLILI
jgi:hypothetical protein